MEIGIVGLPNVGKSSLFNALTASNVQASNFPFTTIEPNIGVVEVPDDRVDFLAELFKSVKIVRATIKFVDIAGLVKGASQGEGLGNQFLSHIRSVDAIAEVVRVFDDPKVIHVHGQVDPQNDMVTINTELMLADLEQASKLIETVRKSKNPTEVKLISFLEKAVSLLNGFQPIRTEPKLTAELQQSQFLTAKPLLYIANVGEKPNQNKLAAIEEQALTEGAKVIEIGIKSELEVVGLPTAEQTEFRTELGLKSGLNEVIRSGYDILNLQTFFTAGPTETHAWTIAKGTKAPQAAGKIHTDFEKGFIRAQVYTFADIREFGSEKAIRDAGKLRSEGKDYVVRDGDVIEFLFNV